MIAELPPSNFKNLIPLFPEVFYNLSSLAVLNKDISGRVWVDNPDNPETCMIVDIEWSIHLGGLHTNKRFNEHAGEVIRSKIFPEAQHHANQIYGNGQVGEWVIYVSNNAWLPKVENEMKIESFLPLRRCYYVYNSLNLDILNWKSTLPKDIRFINLIPKIIQSLKRTSFLENSRNPS